MWASRERLPHTFPIAGIYAVSGRSAPGRGAHIILSPPSQHGVNNGVPDGLSHLERGGVREVTHPGRGGGYKVTPVRRITTTAFPPAVPLSSPSISRPELSRKPDGGVPLIVSWTGLVRANAFLGVSVTVSFAGFNTAERSFVTGEFLAVNDPFPFAVTNR